MRQSLLAVLELLYFQFEFNFNVVEQFILKLYRMCDYRQSNVKKNSLWVRSPNSASKNFFLTPYAIRLF